MRSYAGAARSDVALTDLEELLDGTLTFEGLAVDQDLRWVLITGLARRGRTVVGFEQFPLGHPRGASHDTSRILRHSYHTADYVRLTWEAYADWARLEHDSTELLVSTVGGLDLFPPQPAIPIVDYTQSMDEVGIAYDVLDSVEVTERWPEFRLPDGTVALYQRDAAIVPAGRTTALLQELDPGAVFYGYGDYAIRLLHHVVRRGGRVLEIPTVYRFRKGGESKTRFLAYLWTYLASVLRLRLARR